MFTTLWMFLENAISQCSAHMLFIGVLIYSSLYVADQVSPKEHVYDKHIFKIMHLCKFAFPASSAICALWNPALSIPFQELHRNRHSSIIEKRKISKYNNSLCILMTLCCWRNQKCYHASPSTQLDTSAQCTITISISLQYQVIFLCCQTRLSHLSDQEAVNDLHQQLQELMTPPSSLLVLSFFSLRICDLVVFFFFLSAKLHCSLFFYY